MYLRIIYLCICWIIKCFIHSFIHSFIHLHAVSLVWVVSFPVSYRKQSYGTEKIQQSVPCLRDPTIRPMLAFLSCYRVYLVNKSNTSCPYRLRAKIFARFATSYSCTMKAAINVGGLLIAYLMAVTSYYVYVGHFGSCPGSPSMKTSEVVCCDSASNDLHVKSETSLLGLHPAQITQGLRNVIQNPCCHFVRY